MSQPKPKYKVGQVVMWRDEKLPGIIRSISVDGYEVWPLNGNRDDWPNDVPESALRSQTAREVGPGWKRSKGGR